MADLWVQFRDSVVKSTGLDKLNIGQEVSNAGQAVGDLLKGTAASVVRPAGDPSQLPSSFGGQRAPQAATEGTPAGRAQRSMEFIYGHLPYVVGAGLLAIYFFTRRGGRR